MDFDRLCIFADSVNCRLQVAGCRLQVRISLKCGRCWIAFLFCCFTQYTTKTKNVRFSQRRFSFAQAILNFAQGNSQSSQRSLGDDGFVCISALVHYLFVCKLNKLNKNITLLFLMSKSYLCLHNIEKTSRN